MPPLNDERIAVDMVERIRQRLVGAPKPEMPPYDPRSEALAFNAEYTPEWVDSLEDPLPWWLDCEMERFWDGVEWAQRNGLWDIAGETPRVLNRFAYALGLVLMWWQDNPDWMDAEGDCPEESEWAEFDWETGDRSAMWHVRIPVGSIHEKRFTKWRNQHFRR